MPTHSRLFLWKSFASKISSLHQSKVSQKPGKTAAPISPKSPGFECFFSRNCRWGEKTACFWHRSFSQELSGRFSALLIAAQAAMWCSLLQYPNHSQYRNHHRKKYFMPGRVSLQLLLPWCSVCNFGNLQDCYHALKHLACYPEMCLRVSCAMEEIKLLLKKPPESRKKSHQNFLCG